MGIFKWLTLRENPRGVMNTAITVYACRDCGSEDVIVHVWNHPHHPGYVHCNKCGSCKA